MLNLMNMIKKIYLDIDGVILTSKQTQPAKNIEEFMHFIVENFDCYWLTTHCKGDINPTIKYLSNYFSKTTIYIFKNIKPTNWETLKTEGIDFSSDFIWLDDYPLYSEKLILEKNNCLENLIEVNLNNKDELLRIKDELIKNVLSNTSI
ncbi:hypothetical protein CLV73_1565 [Chryseobacterium geocarposphaerae]|uniref:FCP1 homology domain-containing protein n=2 Tax=Chryseobacterium geocarposphaerae TaxID=1416776 RepID=A0A2M9C9P4_9FLAO|nr:hypothetical protein CLV73_1565 [Chryseobacterium geocarposphaerae]